MKVLHVLPSISRRLGGPTALAFSLIKELRVNGIDAEIASTNDDGEGVIDLPLGVTSQLNGVPCTVFKRSFFRRREYIASPSLAFWLLRNVKRYNLLDLHYLFTFSTSIAAGASLIKGVPYTARTMGELSPWALRQNKRVKALHIALFESWILNRAAAIQCTTYGEKEDVALAGFNKNLEILPLGVGIPTLDAALKDKVRLALGVPSEAFVLLFISRLHKKKRPDFAIDLLAKLPKGAILIIAGSGEATYENALLSKCESLGLGNRVKFLGHVDPKKGEELRQASDMYILPSESDNFALSAAEALASRLPVAITPDVQIAPYIKEANAGLVLPLELDSWCREISSCILDTGLLARWRDNARSLAESEFSISIAAKRLIELYSKILTISP